MTIAANGNVGIGTTTPGTTFQVVGASTLSVTTITGGLVVTGGSLNVGAAASLGGTLNVVGASTLAVTTVTGGLNVTSITGVSNLELLNETITGTLRVNGASILAVTTVTGGLNVTGGSRLAVTTVTGALGVAGVLTVFSAATEQIQLVTGPSLSHIDFCSSGNGDYDTRLRSDGGTGTVGQGKMTVECANFVTPNTTVSGTLNVSGNLRITNAAGLTINSTTTNSSGDKAFINLFEGGSNWGAQLSNDSGDDVFRISMVDSGTPSDKIVIHRTYTTITNAAISMVGSLNVSGSITSSGGIAGNIKLIHDTIGTPSSRNPTPSHQPNRTIGFGFGDLGSPYCDYIHFNTWQDGSGGGQNLLAVDKGAFGMRIYQATFASTSVYSNYRQVVLANQSGDVSITGTLNISGAITAEQSPLFKGNDICLWNTARGGTINQGGVALSHGTDARLWINATNSFTSGVRINNGPLLVSLGSVTATSYFATSDKRIKTNITDLNCPSLDIIRKIRPCEYNMIDGKGKDSVYGFVAQEIKELIPKSVQTVTEFIPSVYENAFVDGNKITLINKTTTDISGCKLKIRDKNGGDIIVDVTTIYDNKIFYINGDITQGISCMDICGTNLDEYTKDGVTTYKRGSQVYTGEVKKGIFVYGIQVDDFHTLDKDTIWTVTLSATKELDTQLQLANSKIAEQDIRIAYLEQTVRRQQADIDAIKLRLG
jgi:hypothetical protein